MSQLSPFTNPNLYRTYEIGGYKYYSPNFIGIGIAMKVEEAQRDLYKQKHDGAEPSDADIQDWLNTLSDRDIAVVFATLSPLLIPAEGSPDISHVVDFFPMSLYSEIMGFFTLSVSGKVNGFKEYLRLSKPSDALTAVTA